MRLRVRLRALLTVLAAVGLMVGFAAANIHAAPSAQAASGERILSFTADYELASDGSLGVTETLVTVANGLSVSGFAELGHALSSTSGATLTVQRGEETIEIVLASPD